MLDLAFTTKDARVESGQDIAGHQEPIGDGPKNQKCLRMIFISIDAHWG
jgi:hypothetical protein